MHAALCRNWQKRIKGRDWYDLIWYIQKDIPLNLTHLRERMRQTKHLNIQEKLEEKDLLQRLHKKIDEIDWNAAKLDISPFVADQRKLDIWSAQFFHDMIASLKIIDPSPQQ